MYLPARSPLLFGLAASLALSAGLRPARGQDEVVFRDVRVFDGVKMIPKTSVVVRGGMIVSVGPDPKAASTAKVIDGQGKTLLPGLIDCHTHAFSVEHLRQAAVFGVTTECDMFTSHAFAASMRAEQKSGRATGRADLVSSGTLVTAPGGHGTQFGLAIPTLTKPEQADAFVEARVKEGSDYIKVISEDGHEMGIPFNSLDRPTIAAVVKAAHAREKLAVVHIQTLENARSALEDGADGLVHVFIDEPIDDAFVRLAVSRKAFVVPTLNVFAAIKQVGGNASVATDTALAPFLSAADAVALRASIQTPKMPAKVATVPKEAVKRLNDAGVPILAGTDAIDAGTAHGASIHREVELLHAAGLTNLQALAAATSVAAKAFRLTDRGRVETGLRADLVLVEGDPSLDVKATRKIVGVWVKGQPIDRAGYQAGLNKKPVVAAGGQPMEEPPGSEKGVVSDFEGDALKSAFGSGWLVSTDSFVGGKSTAELKRVAEGADKSKGSMEITGTVDDKPQPRWAGALFSPGKTPMAPANLSSKKVVSFQARGDGKTYYVMLFSQAKGFMPATLTFVADDSWKEHKFPLKDFDGADGKGVMGLFLGGGNDVGAFRLQVDDVRIE